MIDNLAMAFATGVKNRQGPMPTPRWHQPCRRILSDATPCENHAAVVRPGERLDTRRALRKESHEKFWNLVASGALFGRKQSGFGAAPRVRACARSRRVR